MLPAPQPALFERETASLPPIASLGGRCVGIDVGGAAKGFHAVALEGGRVLEARRYLDPQALVDWCVALDAPAVAVDAPCGWSATGRSRAAERALNAAGIRIYATPTLAVASTKAFYRWMVNGAALYLRLASRYAVFEGGASPPRTYLETYPQAIACALAGRVVRAHTKRADRSALLRHIGVDTARLTNIDYIDAGLCAVAAAYARSGHYRAYGDGREGIIFVPGVRAVTRRAA